MASAKLGLAEIGIDQIGPCIEAVGGLNIAQIKRGLRRPRAGHSRPAGCARAEARLRLSEATAAADGVACDFARLGQKLGWTADAVARMKAKIQRIRFTTREPLANTFWTAGAPWRPRTPTY